MNPYDHARSSARIHGGCWSDYHPIHAWLDSSKATHCHFTHRALHHHAEGIAEAVAVFGPTLRNSDGVEIAIETIARQHVAEDCQHIPSAADWLAGFEVPVWFTIPLPEPEDLARISALRFGGEAANWYRAEQTALEMSASSPYDDPRVPDLRREVLAAAV